MAQAYLEGEFDIVYVLNVGDTSPVLRVLSTSTLAVHIMRTRCSRVLHLGPHAVNWLCDNVGTNLFLWLWSDIYLFVSGLHPLISLPVMHVTSLMSIIVCGPRYRCKWRMLFTQGTNRTGTTCTCNCQQWTRADNMCINCISRHPQNRKYIAHRNSA